MSYSYPKILVNGPLKILIVLLIACSPVLTGCSTTSPPRPVVKFQKLKIICPAPPKLPVIITQKLSPRPITDIDGNIWLGFPPANGEVIWTLVADSIEFAEQAHANTRYYAACIDGFNG